MVGGEASVVRRVQSRERIKGRTKLMTPHVLLRLRVAFSASSLLPLQVSVGDGRACAGNCISFGAWDDLQSLRSGLGPDATAGRRNFVGCEGKDGPLRSPGWEDDARSLLLLAVSAQPLRNRSGHAAPRKLVCLVIWDAIVPKDGLGGPTLFSSGSKLRLAGCPGFLPWFPNLGR